MYVLSWGIYIAFLMSCIYFHGDDNKLDRPEDIFFMDNQQEMASFLKCSRSFAIFLVFYVFLLAIPSQIYFQMSVIIEMEPPISIATLPPDIMKRIIDMEKESLDEIKLVRYYFFYQIDLLHHFMFSHTGFNRNTKRCFISGLCNRCRFLAPGTRFLPE